MNRIISKNLNRTGILRLLLFAAIGVNMSWKFYSSPETSGSANLSATAADGSHGPINTDDPNLPKNTSANELGVKIDGQGNVTENYSKNYNNKIFEATVTRKSHSDGEASEIFTIKSFANQSIRASDFDDADLEAAACNCDVQLSKDGNNNILVTMSANRTIEDVNNMLAMIDKMVTDKKNRQNIASRGSQRSSAEKQEEIEDDDYLGKLKECEQETKKSKSGCQKRILTLLSKNERTNCLNKASGSDEQAECYIMAIETVNEYIKSADHITETDKKNLTLPLFSKVHRYISQNIHNKDPDVLDRMIELEGDLSRVSTAAHMSFADRKIDKLSKRLTKAATRIDRDEFLHEERVDLTAAIGASESPFEAEVARFNAMVSLGPKNYASVVRGTHLDYMLYPPNQFGNPYGGRYRDRYAGGGYYNNDPFAGDPGRYSDPYEQCTQIGEICIPMGGQLQDRGAYGRPGYRGGYAGGYGNDRRRYVPRHGGGLRGRPNPHLRSPLRNQIGRPNPESLWYGGSSRMHTGYLPGGLPRRGLPPTYRGGYAGGGYNAGIHGGINVGFQFGGGFGGSYGGNPRFSQIGLGRPRLPARPMPYYGTSVIRPTSPLIRTPYVPGGLNRFQNHPRAI